MSTMFPARAKKKPAKYRNKPVIVDGVKFDSTREHSRYRTLLLMARAGLICDLRRQVRYELVPANLRADGTKELGVAYIADFVYTQDGRQVVEDLKSEITAKRPDYIIKRKLLLHVHGITLKETT